jgi:hypothetical protein
MATPGAGRHDGAAGKPKTAALAATAPTLLTILNTLARDGKT